MVLPHKATLKLISDTFKKKTLQKSKNYDINKLLEYSTALKYASQFYGIFSFSFPNRIFMFLLLWYDSRQQTKTAPVNTHLKRHTTIAEAWCRREMSQSLPIYQYMINTNFKGHVVVQRITSSATLSPLSGSCYQGTLLYLNLSNAFKDQNPLKGACRSVSDSLHRDILLYPSYDYEGGHDPFKLVFFV